MYRNFEAMTVQRGEQKPHQVWKDLQYQQCIHVYLPKAVKMAAAKEDGVCTEVSYR